MCIRDSFVLDRDKNGWGQYFAIVGLLVMKLPKFFWKAIGVLLILSFFLPIPTGMLRVAIGLSILVCSSLPFALLMQSVRRKFEWFNNLITWIENKLGEKMTEGIRFTRPENDPRDHFKKDTKQD